MIVKRIIEKEYDLLKIVELFEKDGYSRKFAIIEINQKKLKFSWRSDLIDPKIIEVGSKFIAVGIDNDFGLVDRFSLNIKLKIKLIWNFFEILVNKNLIYVISEQEVLVFNLDSLGILKSEMLPDIIKSYNIINDNLVIECFDEISYKI